MSSSSIFFDTDCISSFLCNNGENLVLKLYSSRMVLPKHVLEELSHPSIPHIKPKLDAWLHAGDIATMSIQSGTEEYGIYYKLAIMPRAGHRIIGRGEAAAIALAKAHNGILASNNLQDVTQYVKLYGLQHVTTGHILAESLRRGFITESDGNGIWQSMLHKRRKLPTATFTEYLHNST